MTEACECNLIGVLSDEEEGLVGELTNPIEYVYPKLEDLVVTPTGQDQHFKSEEYGYDNVTVKAVESEELSIMPNTENQEYIGLYNKVSVPGAADLLPENIKKGVNIFGVKGTANVADFKITDASYLFYQGARTDYIQELLAMCENMVNAKYMCYGCTKLTEIDLSNFNTSNVTNMEYMFNRCEKLINLDLTNFNTSNVTNMKYMFDNCAILTNLDVSNFDTSNVTTMYQMFGFCSKLTNLDLSNFDTSNVIDMSFIFWGCNKLINLDLTNFNTNNVTSMKYMFGSCFALTSLDLSSFDMSKVGDISCAFDECRSLTSLKTFKNLGKGFTEKTNNYTGKLNLSKCVLLPHQDLVDLITNGLYDLNLTYDVANGGTLYTQALQLGSTNKEKLEATEEGQAALALAAVKGWTVS